VADWDSRFISLALHIQEWSKDPSTKVGCVIVGPSNEIRSIGYNGFPRGIDDNDVERYDRPAKYLWTEHAERNAIYNAVRVGIPLHGCRMYLPWFPCAACARAIIQSGLIELVAYEPDFGHEKWGQDFRVATTLLDEARVAVRFIGSRATAIGSGPSD
jgi:dCMP deaminase